MVQTFYADRRDRLLCSASSTASRCSRSAKYTIDHVLQMRLPFNGPEAVREVVTRFQARCERWNVVPGLMLQYNRAGTQALRNLYLPQVDGVMGSSAFEQMSGTLLFLTRPLLVNWTGREKELGTMLRAVRDGTARYEDAVAMDQVRVICMKSRDLGSRDDKTPFHGHKPEGPRGRGASRTLHFQEGFFRSTRYVEVLQAKHGYDWNDASRIPTSNEIQAFAKPPL